MLSFTLLWLQNLLEEYWQSKHFLDLKAEIDAEAEYGAQLERMDIRNFPARDAKPFSPFDYEGSINPFDPVQPASGLHYSGLSYSGPLHLRELELGMLEGTSGNSYILGVGNTPPWEARLHEHTSPPLPRLQKVNPSIAANLFSCNAMGHFTLQTYLKVMPRKFEIDRCVVTAFKWNISRPNSVTYLNCTPYLSGMRLGVN